MRLVLLCSEIGIINVATNLDFEFEHSSPVVSGRILEPFVEKNFLFLEKWNS